MADQEKLVCPICGEPTHVYYGNARKDRLCIKHGKLLKNGEIFIDSHGRFREAFTKNVLTQAVPKITETETPKSESIAEPAAEETKIVIINEENKSRCITCGRKTDGLLFCASCYKKYHNKELLFKIKGCSSIELLDEDYEGRFTCKDGHVVKSKSEREIDNYLFEKGIPHAYEKELPYGKTEKETLHPDFYLPHYLGKDKHVWIEHWGYDDNNRDYAKTKKFKMPIYEKLGITLICTYERTDTGDIDATLDRKLKKDNIDENTINFK